jgi:hypothetical protein
MVFVMVVVWLVVGLLAVLTILLPPLNRGITAFAFVALIGAACFMAGYAID